jgi:hypothetical protein
MLYTWNLHTSPIFCAQIYSNLASCIWALRSSHCIFSPIWVRFVLYALRCAQRKFWKIPHVETWTVLVDVLRRWLTMRLSLLFIVNATLKRNSIIGIRRTTKNQKTNSGKTWQEQGTIITLETILQIYLVRLPKKDFTRVKVLKAIHKISSKNLPTVDKFMSRFVNILKVKTVESTNARWFNW